MFHMLTSTNLKAEATLKSFSSAMADFYDHMHGLNLVESMSPIGTRRQHPVLDTEHGRGHQYYFTMSFRNEQQVDRAVEYIRTYAEPGLSLHKRIHALIDGQTFICWEDQAEH